MFGSIFSVLLMGMVPAWGTQEYTRALSEDIRVAPPALTADAGALASLRTLSASGVIIMDLDSGQMLYGREEDRARPMASLTKLMTALLIVEDHALDERVTVPADIGEVQGNVLFLAPGEVYSVGDLLTAVLISSANDAAVTLARFHSGTIEAFADRMNERAQELGLSRTRYENPTGLDAPPQVSSPRDLAWLAMFVLTKPPIAERMALPSSQIRGSRGSVLDVTHTHQLLRGDVSDVRGGKTGTTLAAQQCLLSIIEIRGRRYVSVLLHSSDRYADMRVLLANLPR